MVVFVVSIDGKPLMPTFNIKKVRKLLKSGCARICCHHPFTVQLLYETSGGTQPVEMTEDTGYEHVGISIKSEKHEYAHAEYTLLKDEKQRHDAQRREHRRPRRSRKRHRAPRFSNRNKPKGWLAPSLKNKADRHVDLYKRYAKVCPITSVTLEAGQFDTQVLQAIQFGKPIPKGTDYQHGPMYEHDTIREAVFARDGYRCAICGRSAIKDNLILALHHRGYWKGDRSNRLSNLSAVCINRCHIHKNHLKGGPLWGLEPIEKGMPQAAFMNTVKWYIYEEIKKTGVETHITYGAVTKRERLDRNIVKTHANDAYCIGTFHPKHRARPVFYRKLRRNNRVLERFYDAKYIDIRDGKAKKSGELSCGRTNRSTPRNNPNSERKYRGKKVSKGRRAIRIERYNIQPGDTVYAKKMKVKCKGVMSNGRSVLLLKKKESPTGKAVSASIKTVQVVSHANGWLKQ